LPPIALADAPPLIGNGNGRANKRHKVHKDKYLNFKRIKEGGKNAGRNCKRNSQKFLQVVKRDQAK
jgi:hypothetical protein